MIANVSNTQGRPTLLTTTPLRICLYHFGIFSFIKIIVAVIPTNMPIIERNIQAEKANMFLKGSPIEDIKNAPRLMSKSDNKIKKYLSIIIL